MQDSTEPQVTPELLSQLDSLLPAVAWTSTVPIMVMQNGILRQHGTGSLFRIAETSFLVTAGHVLREAAKHKLKIAIGVKSSLHPLQPAGRDIYCTDWNREISQNDPIDVAIWRLDAKTVGHLSQNTFVRMTDIVTPVQFEEDFYFVCGFPCQMATEAAADGESVNSTPLQFCTTLFDGDLTRAPGYDARRHILLNAERTFLHQTTGTSGGLPTKFNGLSGCGIWKTNALSRSKDRWKPGQAKLVAVETSAYPNYGTHQIIRGTNWSAAATLIVSVYPELKPAFELALRHD